MPTTRFDLIHIQPRTRNFTTRMLMVLACAACVLWPASVQPLHAKVQVPFRLMEATISETQAALDAGTVTSEDLANMYIARIAAFDKTGPAINAMIRMNPNALGDARALDAERRQGHTRGPLHGIPVVLKDNYDTFDMPT